MKDSVNGNTTSNIYTYNVERALDAYSPFIDGNADALVCVVSTNSVSENAKSALEATCVKLNFGQNRIAWVCLGPISGDAKAESRSPLNGDLDDVAENADAGIELSAHDLYQIIESLDPAAIITTDANSSSAFGIAYGCAIETDRHNRVLCRNVIAFKDFESMLDTPDAKQRAWHLLKYLK